MLEGEWYCKWDKISQASQTGSLQAMCGSFVFFWWSTKLFKTNCEYGPKVKICK